VELYPELELLFCQKALRVKTFSFWNLETQNNYRHVIVSGGFMSL